MVKGRRVYDTDLLERGDYGKHPFNGIWYARAPVDGNMTANLKAHTVIEAPDGTITVSPSIMITYVTKVKTITWHGYLEQGFWREC